MDIEKAMRDLDLEGKAALCPGADFSRTKAMNAWIFPAAMTYNSLYGLRKQLEGLLASINR